MIECVKMVVFFILCSNNLNGQILRLPAKYAIKDEPFAWFCDIAFNDVSNTVSIKKENEFDSRCTVDLKTCSKKQNISAFSYHRYDCGCVNNHKNLIYMNTSRVSVDDQGSWVCRSSYQNSDSVPKFPAAVFLPVYYGPEMNSIQPDIVTLESYNLTEGDTYTFTCNASCNPPCSVNWFKNSTHGSQMISQNSNLTFYNVDRSLDGAEYFCRVTQSQLGRQKTQNIKPIRVFYGPNDIKFNVNDTIFVNEGDNFPNISCFDDCYPNCTFEWTDNESNKIYRDPYGSYNLYYGDAYVSNNGTLSLYHINRRETGIFMCEATNNATGQSYVRNLTVIVQYSPDINMSTNYYGDETSEGSEVIIDCRVYSVPEAKISWHRESKKHIVISTDESLIIPEATYSDSDTYICTADNGVGEPVSKNVSLTVRCRAKIDSNSNENTISGKPVVVDYGGTAVLPIHVIANPRPSFSWYKLFPSGKETSVTDFRTKQDDTESSSVLSIENMNLFDYGYYKVYVRNSEGVRSQVFNVVPTS